MQRSVPPSLTSSRRLGRRARLLGAVAVASTLLVGGAGAAAAGDKSQDEPKTTGAYVYLKKDDRKPASWPNSNQQYLVTTWSGWSWRDLSLEEVRAALPAGLTLCGPGWGIQEDQAYGDKRVFTESKAPKYPYDYIGWRTEKNPKGAIYDAKHFELSDMVTVPPCEPAPTTTPTATPTATPTPTVTPTATPTPTESVPVPVPVPSETSTPTPTPSVTPTPVAEVDDEPTSTPTPTSEVLAGTPTPTPSASFYSQVLAAGGGTGGQTLAATGSSPVPGVLAGGILVLAGAALVLARRLRSS